MRRATAFAIIGLLASWHAAGAQTTNDARRFSNTELSDAKPDLKTLQALVQRKFTGFPVPQSLP